MSSTNVGSIHYDLDLKKDKFDKGASAVKGAVSDIGDAAGALATKLKLVGLAAGAALGAAGFAAVKSAGNYEQLSIAFETMLGSGEAAGKMLKDISDFARQTPFDLPQVAEGAKSLLAYGIEAEKIIPTFNALGNIAAGVGKDKLPFLTLAFGQVRTAGKLTGQELRQFTEAGVPLLELLAQQAGTTAAQIKEDMEDGAGPSFEEVEKAIFGASQEGGKFFNLMQKQSQTFEGSLSNMRDGIGRVGRAIVGIDEQGNIRDGSIFQLISTGAAEALAYLDTNTAAISSKMTTFIDQVIGAVRGLIAEFRQWMPAIQAVAIQVADYLSPKLQEMWRIIELHLMPALRNLWEKVLKPLAPVVGVLLVFAFGRLIDFTNHSIKVFSTLVSTGSNVIGMIVNLMQWVYKLWVRVRDSFNSIRESMKRVFGDNYLFEAGKKMIMGLVDGIKSVALAPVNAAKNILNKVRDLFPFSPAKDGPFSGKGWTLYSGESLMEGFAQGIDRKVQLPQTHMADAMGQIKGAEMQQPIQATTNRNETENVNITINMDGIMARSASDMRDIFNDGLALVNQQRRAQGKPAL